MAKQSFSSEEVRKRATEAIKQIESVTSAEVVVAVRRASGFYRHADYLFGFAVSLLVLCVLLVHPQPFEILLFPVEVTLGFVVGAFVCSRFSPLRRLLSGKKRMEENVLKGAHATFHEMGVSHTTGRTGLLIYVSLFERRAEVVLDMGVLAADPGPEFMAIREKLRQAVRRLDPEAFLEAMLAMGPLLEVVLPRSEDDVNELPDEVCAA